ncbi:acetolactate decarboxylase [Methanofollis aquaemaris]|uniref:Alpha-acetolactate decarboxylase n=1 Tax=Methanofollis aquaemaris TaxID=126734 RepID=A0A8A3S5J3_9EURY|nr:acetolactate decarboxylase [Methanofollis aquaemaris]QSZ67408.1 acetolactate decarboxylase [Methanofollis aquaemaris]
MKPQEWKLALFLMVIAVAGIFASSSFYDSFAGNIGESETLFQVSTLSALLQGVYDGETEIGTLLEKGDTGIGTLNTLDGELIILDGRAWQVCGDGSVHAVDPTVRTPYASVTSFSPDITLELSGPLDLPTLEAAIRDALPSENLPCAVVVEGTFANLTARSVDRQEAPYPPLVEVTADQHVFSFDRTEGTIVGFYLPAYLEGVGVSGFHLHFLSDDRNGGGHLLGCTTERVRVLLDITPELDLSLPSRGPFLDLNLSGDQSEGIEAAEGGK